MIIRTSDGWNLGEANTGSEKCGNCSNTITPVVYVRPFGPQIGLAFLKKPLISRKQYFLICPICSAIANELTKELAHKLVEPR